MIANKADWDHEHQGMDGGSLWHSGSGVPVDTLGNNNDYYLDLPPGDVYKKTLDTWSKIGNIKGDPGIPGSPGTLPGMGICFQIINPTSNEESPKYIIETNCFAKQVRVNCSNAPSAATNILVYKNATIIANFSISTVSTTYDINPDVELLEDDELSVKINGSPNGITKMSIQVTVI